jgi:hypothetical protein
MLSKQEEEQERRETLENDRLVREAEHRRIRLEGTTFHQFGQSQAHDEVGGRFASISPITVVGANPTLKYPAAAAHQADPVPIEPPLGFSVDDMPIEPSTVVTRAVEDTGGAAASAASSAVEPAPPPSSAIGGELTPAETFPASGSTATVGAPSTNSEER